MADGTLHSGWRGLECFCHLRVQYLGDGIDHIHVVNGDDDGFAQVLVTLDMGRNTDGVRRHVYGVNALVFIKLLLL